MKTSPDRKRNSKRKSAETALRERVKELECLYAVAQICAKPGRSASEVFQQIADILPSAWRFPKRAFASITFDGATYSCGPFPSSHDDPLTEPLVVQGVNRGQVTIGYPSATKIIAPFLDEERRLLSEVARQIGQFAEGLEAKQEQEDLREQVWHMERLVTVGQLASGVAHELNEPLGSILGFTQLLAKTPGIPHAAQQDLARIEAAALHARDIIRKMMLFARDSSPTLGPVSVNMLLHESAVLLMWRCEDSDVDVRYLLDPQFPVIKADEGQMRQVIINLMVNAIQAMPEGGVLTLSTSSTPKELEFSVSDTGQGIEPDNLTRIFDPFFTTKDIEQGTGLGLSVVHGIITAHKGSIRADSTPGQGTCMRVLFSHGEISS